MSDPWMVRSVFHGHPGKLIDYAVQLILAVGVVVAAKVWMRYKESRAAVVVLDR